MGDVVAAEISKKIIQFSFLGILFSQKDDKKSNDEFQAQSNDRFLGGSSFFHKISMYIWLSSVVLFFILALFFMLLIVGMGFKQLGNFVYWLLVSFPFIMATIAMVKAFILHQLLKKFPPKKRTPYYLKANDLDLLISLICAGIIGFLTI